MKNDELYLAQIKDCVRKIKSYTSAMDYQHFAADEKTQSAVTMQLVLIGELTKKVSETLRHTIDLPWKQMAGLRDMAVHNYFSLDVEAIWKTVTERLDEVTEKLKHY